MSLGTAFSLGYVLAELARLMRAGRAAPQAPPIPTPRDVFGGRPRPKPVA